MDIPLGAPLEEGREDRYLDRNEHGFHVSPRPLERVGRLLTACPLSAGVVAIVKCVKLPNLGSGDSCKF